MNLPIRTLRLPMDSGEEALIAATVANDGQMPAPRLIEKAVDADGLPVPRPRHSARRVMDARTAQAVARMMVLTTTMGTARTAFHDRRGRSLLPVAVAGKTGTLSYRGRPADPQLPVTTLMPQGGYLGYSWFVGFVPAHKPRVAFAVVLGNAANAQTRAAHVARRLVGEYLAAQAATRGGRILASR